MIPLFYQSLSRKSLGWRYLLGLLQWLNSFICFCFLTVPILKMLYSLSLEMNHPAIRTLAKDLTLFTKTHIVLPVMASKWIRHAVFTVLFKVIVLFCKVMNIMVCFNIVFRFSKLMTNFYYLHCRRKTGHKKSYH